MNIPIAVKECNPFELKSISWRERSLIPYGSGLYFVLYDNQVIYIGKSESIKLRLTCHDLRVSLSKIIDQVKIAWLQHPDFVDRKVLGSSERYTIALFRPPLNKLKYISSLETLDYVLNNSPNTSMNNTNLDRVGVKQLTDRYKIGRTTLYKRFKDLGIKTQTIGNKSFVDSSQLELLDKLHEHIESGNQTAEFLDMLGIPTRGSDGELYPEPDKQLTIIKRTKEDEQIPEQWRIAYALTTIADRMTDPLQPLKMQQERLKMLAEIAEQGWLIPTSQMLQLLGLRSTPELIDGWFRRRGFMFVKAGRKGREIEWRVRKY